MIRNKILVRNSAVKRRESLGGWVFSGPLRDDGPNAYALSDLGAIEEMHGKRGVLAWDSSKCTIWGAEIVHFAGSHANSALKSCISLNPMQNLEVSHTS